MNSRVICNTLGIDELPEGVSWAAVTHAYVAAIEKAITNLPNFLIALILLSYNRTFYLVGPVQLEGKPQLHAAELKGSAGIGQEFKD